MTIGGVPYVGEYDEDIGSTLYFDRSRLQQVADVHAAAEAPAHRLDAPVGSNRRVAINQSGTRGGSLHGA